MSASIAIRASLRIERPADVVRQQYRDIDHHIRNNVHPSRQARSRAGRVRARQRGRQPRARARAAGTAGARTVELRVRAARLLDAACLIAIVDSHVEPAERDAIRRVQGMLSAEPASGSVEERLGELAAAATSDRIAAQIDRIGEAAQNDGLGRSAVIAAAVVGLVSQGLSLGELAALKRLAQAAGVDADDLVIDGVEAALAGA